MVTQIIILGVLASGFVVLTVLYVLAVTSSSGDGNDIRFTTRTTIEKTTAPIQVSVLMQTNGNSHHNKASWPFDTATSTIENVRFYVTDKSPVGPLDDLGTYLTDGNDTRIREAFLPEVITSPTAEDASGLTAKYSSVISINGTDKTTKTLQVYGRIKANDGSYYLVHSSTSLADPINGIWINVSYGLIGVYTSELEPASPSNMGELFTSVH